jgi:hypothetical protein
MQRKWLSNFLSVWLILCQIGVILDDRDELLWKRGQKRLPFAPSANRQTLSKLHGSAKLYVENLSPQSGTAQWV